MNCSVSIRIALTAVTGLCLMSFCAQNNPEKNDKEMASEASKENQNTESPARDGEDHSNIDTVTFGAGCFWCVEAIFQRLDGVLSVKSGYSGGDIINPTYKDVCSGNTGHAEVIRLTYDKSKVSFDELLEVFWKTHDPTSMNRQGNDIGTQYRSVIFYHNEEQKTLAEKYKKALDGSGAYSSPVVTEISPLKNYYPAEDYHQNYFNQNKSQSYCQFVIQPKIEKFEKVFGKKLKH